MTAPAVDVAVERRETESPAPDRPPPRLIEPVRGWVPLGLRELADFRELLYFLVWRDLKVRYKQTALGVTWSVLQPVLTALIFTLIFGRLVGVPSDGVPYALVRHRRACCCGSCFAQSVSSGKREACLRSRTS